MYIHVRIVLCALHTEYLDVSLGGGKLHTSAGPGFAKVRQNQQLLERGQTPPSSGLTSSSNQCRVEFTPPSSAPLLLCSSALSLSALSLLLSATVQPQSVSSAISPPTGPPEWPILHPSTKRAACDTPSSPISFLPTSSHSLLRKPCFSIRLVVLSFPTDHLPPTQQINPRRNLLL